jgi:hypothetical protein
MSEEQSMRLTILPEGQARFGPCHCCGRYTERVWGFLERSEETLAAYYVEWTPGHEDKAANFDLIVGRWGEGAEASHRRSVALEFRQLENGPAFKVIDAATRSYAASTLTGSAMSRDEVLEGDMRELVFALVDTVYLDDPRIDFLRAPLYD